MTFRKWYIRCEPCDARFYEWAWDSCLPIICKDCGAEALLWSDKLDNAPGIACDSIPGGLEIRHLTETPQKFYSKTDIKRACNEHGWVWSGDTPKAYRVPWSGRKKSESSE